MTSSKPSHVVVLAGDAHPALAADIAQQLDLPLTPTDVATFADGETHIRITADVLDATVVIVQPTAPPVNDRLIALGLLTDAALAAGAGRVIAVVPYFGYSRQEQRGAIGEPRSARMAAQFLGQTGIGHLITLDLHAPALESAFGMPATLLRPDALFLPLIRQWCRGDVTIVAPDAGGMKRAQRFADDLGAKLAVVTKMRTARDVASPLTLLGDVRGCECVIVDDLASTGRTLAGAAQLLHDGGAAAVHAVFTHAVMAEGALERILAAPLERLATSDSIRPPDHDRLQVIPASTLLSEAVRQVIGRDT